MSQPDCGPRGRGFGGVALGAWLWGHGLGAGVEGLMGEDGSAARETPNLVLRLLDWAAKHNKLAATLIAGSLLVIVGVYLVRATGVPPSDFLVLAALVLVFGVVVQLLVAPREDNKSPQRQVIEWGVTGLVISSIGLLVSSSAFGIPDERACLLSPASQECQDERVGRKKLAEPPPAEPAGAGAPTGSATGSATDPAAGGATPPVASAPEGTTTETPTPEPTTPTGPATPGGSVGPVLSGPIIRNPDLVVTNPAVINSLPKASDLSTSQVVSPQLKTEVQAVPQMSPQALGAAASGLAMPDPAFGTYRVFIQFAGYNRQAVTVPLSVALMEGGWSVAGGDQGGQRLRSAEGVNEVRYNGAANLAAARALAAAINNSGRLPKRLRVVESSAVDPGTLEIWLSRQ